MSSVDVYDKNYEFVTTVKFEGPLFRDIKEPPNHIVVAGMLCEYDKEKKVYIEKKKEIK